MRANVYGDIARWAIVWGWVLRLFVLQAWVVAVLWIWRAVAAAVGLPKVPDLLHPAFDASPITGPSLTVIVPALNEEDKVAACLESLIAQDYESLQIVAVNDRSTDRTGSVMDALARKHPGRLQVLHITELPDGWLGKTHAMALAARQSTTEYLLFTDADILFRSDALRRSMGFAVATGADHLVTIPTLILKRWDESALLGFLQVCALWAARPWKVADAKAKRDAVGVGAFNLLSRSGYFAVGGFEALRMEIVEDLTIARKVRRAGLKQRVAFGKDLVSLHWAAGAIGVVRITTKNMFSAFGFRMSIAVAACGWLVTFCVLPEFEVLAGLWWRSLLLPGSITLSALYLVYRSMRKYSGISAWYVIMVPFAAVLVIYAMMRSVVTTLRQGGVVWRGTFYPLKELKRHVAPLW